MEICAVDQLWLVFDLFADQFWLVVEAVFSTTFCPSFASLEEQLVLGLERKQLEWQLAE